MEKQLRYFDLAGSLIATTAEEEAVHDAIYYVQHHVENYTMDDVIQLIKMTTGDVVVQVIEPIMTDF